MAVRPIRRVAAGIAAAALSMSVLAACGGDSGKPVLTWYINPDPNPPPDFKGTFGQAGIAERCSNDEYTIETQILPQSATEQRIQLLRRLAAEDKAVDLMSLDPVFTAEFADAGYLAKLPQELSDGMLQGAIDGASWDGQLVVAPLWANTQILWYRKSMAEKAGLDMTQPVTWDQIIDAASDQGGKVGVQANKYEGYVVWINALLQGAGGALLSDTEAGADAEVTVDSEAGREAAKVIAKLAKSPAAEADLSVSNEGTVIGPFAKPGGFMVNWTFIYNTVKPDTATFEDLGYARYPETVAGEESKPPIGGINVGVSKFTDDREAALKAVECITSEENQVTYAVETGNMPAREAAYEDAGLREQFPPELLTLWLNSIDTAGPRPPSPYWGTIVGAVLNKWHPASSVGDGTPKQSASFIKNVLSGDALL
ncbi:extracellular solute-binding protein [Aeromicrobium sp.]|uniref:extracellular solute-binding protein n=1 Tax=Aeromicrobium sp. TaxID=1871063 RepID=UPI002FC9A5F1